MIAGPLASRTANDTVGLTVWSENLTNKAYFTSRIAVSSLGFNDNHLGPPRTHGASLDHKF